MSNIKPIYLLADSQLLFTRNAAGEYFLQSVRIDIDKPDIKAAYIGWSNHDLPEFYDLFKQGMQNLGIANCHMISSAYSPNDRQNLQEADLILLAGGDVEAGVSRMLETGVVEVIKEKYNSGAVLIGISAGAIQLGWQMPAAGDSECEMEMMRLVPYIIAAHDEERQWNDLKNTVRISDRKGIGIPFGAGLKYYPDQSIESINKTIEEFS